MEFEWHPDKAASNFQKHGVAFQEAATVFGGALSLTFPDLDHSVGEERCITIGISQLAQLLVVSHTDQGDRIRIISARRATRQEQRFYEEDS